MKTPIAGISRLWNGKTNGRGLDLEVSVARPQTARSRSVWDLLLGKPWVLVLSLVCLVYAATFYILPGRIGGVLAAQVVVPGMWLLVAASTYLLARREGKGHLVFTKKLLRIGLLVGAFQVSVFVIAGLFLGFGNSPYASSLVGMLTNLFIVGSLLVGMEFSRAYLMSVLGKKRLMLTLGFLAVLFALVLIPPARFTSLNNVEDAMQLTGRFILPDMSESLLATFLAFLGGPIAAIAYRGVMVVFECYSPILPDLPWLATGFVGTAAAMLGFLIVQGMYLPLEQAPEAPPTTPAVVKKRGSGFVRILGRAATGLLLLLLLVVILLNVSFLGFQSVTVVTGSMAPAINEGDIVITKVVPLEELQVGDVIKYHRNGINIIHRIIANKGGEDGILFTTKGDANNAVDRPGATSQEIEGKVIGRIPKLGSLTLWLKQR